MMICSESRVHVAANRNSVEEVRVRVFLVILVQYVEPERLSS